MSIASENIKALYLNVIRKGEMKKMDKVKITQELADAIELMMIKGSPAVEIVLRHHDKELIKVNGWEHVAELSTDFLIRTLYIGYQIEETPHDKVKKYYELFEHGSNRETFNALMVQDVIVKVLDLLNIKIEGVNHE